MNTGLASGKKTENKIKANLILCLVRDRAWTHLEPPIEKGN